MRHVALATAALASMLAFTACDPPAVNVAANAVQQGAHAVGNDSVTVITLSAGDVTRLADQVRVDERFILEIAPKLSAAAVVTCFTVEKLAGLRT